MDPKVCDESVKEASDFKCQNILQPIDESIVCPTPEKKTELLPNKFKDPIAQLPEKVIADLFRHMSCALRLLHLRKKSPTFLNVCSKVEVLAKRNFSLADLAQMKYILPEGVEIEKVVVIDKKSLCMKPDLKITLVFEVVKDRSEQSADIALRQYFNSRLINFFNLHPQVTKIPESRLPEPFSQEACNLTFNNGRADIAAEPSSTSNETVELLKNLHLTNLAAELSSTSNEIVEPLKYLHLTPSSKSLSQKNTADPAKLVQSFSSSENSLSSDESDSLDDQESESTWQKECTPLSDSESNLNAESGKQKESLSMSFQTPALSAPERLVLGSDVKLQKMTAQKSTSGFKPAKRVLDFTSTEGNGDLDNRVDLLESSKAMHGFHCSSKLSKGCPEDCKSFDSVSLPREVQQNLCYSFEKINQNQISSDAADNDPPSLVKLVNVIDSIFSSVNTNEITKEELLQKIMRNCLDFVETREAEEQIKILEKILPDWICKKSLASVDGVTMYCVNNEIDLDSVRSRLLSNVTKGDE
ncbi:unnamed protein product [Vicia faba]|uniref:CDT1 Geminin-binding domain-containing protein n=1 Tax=Vicia faba TaxID=3906 RepID=A0AAV0Z0X4_VICFA|nr:unnamed protein product [Vicia faba]